MIGDLAPLRVNLWTSVFTVQGAGGGDQRDRLRELAPGAPGRLAGQSVAHRAMLRRHLPLSTESIVRKHDPLSWRFCFVGPELSEVSHIYIYLCIYICIVYVYISTTV